MSLSLKMVAVDSKYTVSDALMKKAKKYADKAQWDLANKELEKVLEVDPDFWQVYELMGNNYKMMQDFSSSIIAYENALKNKNYAPRVILPLVELYTNDNNFEKAKSYAELYLKQDNLDEAGVQYCKKMIATAGFAMEAIKHPVPFSPLNVGDAVNTTDYEYFPYLSPDGKTLTFTRMKDNQEDLYFAEKSGAIFNPAISFGVNINAPQTNEGACAASADGNFLFITACDRIEGKGSCDIYFSRKENYKWSTLYNIGSPVNSAEWEAHPSISSDGNILYFSSNRPGGYGGRDIWMSKNENGKWGKPENLGPNVNTVYDDQCPFIHPDNVTLYFTSNGWPGMGNADIFISRKSEQGWSKSENVGYPINTGNEDNGMTVSYDGKTAFLSSSRTNTLGGLDIFSFELPEKIRPEKITFVKAIIKDKKNMQLLDATYSLTNLETSDIAYKGTTINASFYVSIKPKINYALEVQKEGYLFYSQNINLKDTLSKEPYELDVLLEPIEVNNKMVLNNVFFDFDKDILKENSFVELDKVVELLQKNPSLKVELSGHTDSKGDDKYNQSLSQKRAESVVNYLIQNGVSSPRLIAKGYGETQPVVSNDTDENRALNRRTELKIIGN